MSRLLAILLLCLPVAATAAPRCPTDAQRATYHAFAERLERAGTPDEAKEDALAKIRLGQVAIDRAARIVPDDAVADARGKLDRLEAGVRGARTQHEVAAQFTALDTRAASCSYDTFEVVIIVIGFVLGILPGVLFLLLFC